MERNEGATGMTTDRPFIHDPVRNFSKVPPAWFSPPVAAVKQLLDVGRTVQYLAAQPGEGKQTAVTVLLQAAAAHFQLFSQFAVRIEVLARHRR